MDRQLCKLTHKVKLSESTADEILENSKCNDGYRMRVIRKYVCDFCGQFHVTSMTNRQHKRNEKHKGYGNQVDISLVNERLEQLTRKK